MDFSNSHLRSIFFTHLDESRLLKDLEREEISGSRFLSFRKSSGGVDYCIKIPRTDFRKKLGERNRTQNIARMLCLVGRDSFSLLPPMWAQAHETYGIILIMPWGDSVEIPQEASGTEEYLRKKYNIEFFDVIQCHSWQGLTFISDWSDICFPSKGP